MTHEPRSPSLRLSRDRDGRTPLHHAVVHGDIVAVQHLLDQAVDVNIQDHRGWSALHFAAQANNAPITVLLLHAHAKVDLTDRHGNTPLFTAVFNAQGVGTVITLLRRAGADPYHHNAHGQSPIGLARLIANSDVAQFFDDLPPI